MGQEHLKVAARNERIVPVTNTLPCTCIYLSNRAGWFYGWKDPFQIVHEVRERRSFVKSRTTIYAKQSTSKLKCSPQNNVLFLKTHKTGSSTMSNMFFRYGDLRNLTFVLPKFILFEWPERFQVSFAVPLDTRTPNMLCSHTRFNKKPMNWLFPKETSKYITILRNPVDNFDSVFRYMGLGKYLGVRNGKNSLQIFLKNGIPFSTMDKRPHDLVTLIRNPLLFDLGLSFKYYQNLTAVNEYIQFLDKEFDLVMIMDYFDESLVLMKRLLCWEMDDILYLKLNERQDKEKDTILTDDVKENVKRWNKADVLLFEYFNKSLWRKIENEGESFYKELAIFRERNSEVKRACVTNETRLQTIYEGKRAKGYVIKSDTPSELQTLCQKLLISEKDYLQHLRVKQQERMSQFTVDPPRNEIEHEREDKESWDLAKDLVYEPV
ncbi:galactosylceramide sulfotransferase-like [Oculina patagonica]